MSASCKRYSWEDPPVPWSVAGGGHAQGEGVQDGPPDPVSAEDAGEFLVQFLLGLLYTNNISARSLCVICYWAHLAGAKGPVGEYAEKPDSSSGHFQRRVDRVTGIKLSEMCKAMYRVPTPQHAKYDMCRTVHPMPVGVPHEELAKEFAEDPFAATGPSEPEWTESFKTHPVVRRHPNELVMPLGLYLDGISFTNRDSLLGIFIYSLHTMKRHLVAILRRSHFCKCGCRGWCTLYPVLSMIHWSLCALAQGQWPSTRHNGPWDANDTERKAKGGQSLGFYGALLQVRGDWSEFSHTLGFADWSSKNFCCIFCDATRDNRFNLSGFGPRMSPWRELTQADVEEACRRCEVWVSLSKEQHLEVLGALDYDKRKSGGAGRCLLIDIPELQLEKGDRLEPHPGMPEVGMFEDVSTFPCRALFWRRANETRTRHRNPLFDAEIGLTLDSLQVDKLHTLHLGPAQTWACHAMWRLILNDAYGTRAKGEQLHRKSVDQMKNELWEYYRAQRRLVPRPDITELSDLTLAMLGNRPTTQALSTKAAETKGLVPFVLEQLRQRRASIPEPEVAYMIDAGAALQRYFDLLHQSPRNVPEKNLREMFVTVKRHIELSEKAGVPLKPKHHLMLHLVTRTRRHGNPGYYSTFEDESINRVVKKIGQAAHRSVWEARMFAHFRMAEDARMGAKRPRAS